MSVYALCSATGHVTLGTRGTPRRASNYTHSNPNPDPNSNPYPDASSHPSPALSQTLTRTLIRHLTRREFEEAWFQLSDLYTTQVTMAPNPTLPLTLPLSP